MSKKKKGARNRLKAILRLNRHLAGIARRRKDAAEKATTHIARQRGVVVFEALQVRNMTASARGTAQAPGRNVAQKASLTAR